MRKAYLFIFNDDVGTRAEVKKVIDSMQTVVTWRYDIAHCFYIVSDHSARELYKDFTEKNGTKGRFMFMESSSNRQGQMLSKTWHFLTHKTHKPDDE